MNVENINKLIDHLESIPEVEYNQKWYMFKCGSPACIAGHAVRLARGKDYSLEGSHISLIAGKWLGINEVTKKKMFHARNYCKTDAPTTKDAINMLKNLIETGEVVWRKENEC